MRQRPVESMQLADGSSAVWEHAVKCIPFEAGKVYPLTFAIHDPSGAAVKLEPYMGMMGHAVVLKYDGSVYMHLHPVGTFSMASQEILEGRIKKDAKKSRYHQTQHVFGIVLIRVITKIRNMERNRTQQIFDGRYAGNGPCLKIKHNKMDAMVTFPLCFSFSAGKYRIWVQMKRNGQILNSAFDATVQ